MAGPAPAGVRVQVRHGDIILTILSISQVYLGLFRATATLNVTSYTGNVRLGKIMMQPCRPHAARQTGGGRLNG